MRRAKIKVKIGDRISFQRKELNPEGIVETVRDNSVIAAISNDDATLLGYETAKTVIKHRCDVARVDCEKIRETG